ncbi:hypothetical protein BU15DRAFT_61482 [Melanogaster broomeanus]|nr:hypothetical protein BU15DRAFT_61482 [Melanogaster broomeanus]
MLKEVCGRADQNRSREHKHLRKWCWGYDVLRGVPLPAERRERGPVDDLTYAAAWCCEDEPRGSMDQRRRVTDEAATARWIEPESKFGERRCKATRSGDSSLMFEGKSIPDSTRGVFNVRGLSIVGAVSITRRGRNKLRRPKGKVNRSNGQSHEHNCNGKQALTAYQPKSQKDPGCTLLWHQTFLDGLVYKRRPEGAQLTGL